MAPAASAKRSRRAAFDDDDEDDGIVISEASSSFRNESLRKKVRASTAGPSKPSNRSRREQSAESSEEDEVMQEDGEAPPAATQYQIMRDAGFRHLEHTEEDDKRATQRLHKRPELIGENHAALNAVIESIECVNFMCHERLTVELGPLLNFIVGENGSGKSAVLTAITLCLGGKASSTNRGASLRSFIKEGQEHANLSVKIKNQGSDAYKHDLYGDSIRVERHFTKSGSSGFKVKSDTGRIISNKKADVDDIVEYFCLQVDNPLNVLSQDNARQFLNAATPATKYKYFLQGTQLEQLDNDLQVFNELLEQNDEKLFEYEETITELKDRFKKAQQLKETADKHEEWRLKSRIYVRQLAWGQVAEQETILQEKENVISAKIAEIQSLESLVLEKTETLDRHDGRIQAAKATLENTRQDEEPLQEKQLEADEKYKAAKTTLETLHTQQREVNEQLKLAAKNANDYKKKIDAEGKRLAEVTGGAVAQKQKNLEDARQAEQDAKDAVDEHTNALPGLRKDYEEAELQLQEAGKLVDSKRSEVNGVETRIRTLNQTRSDPLACYEPQVPRLLRAIEEDSGFHHKPIGPIGSYIQLTQPQWSPMLEKLCGQTLSAFIVADKDDHTRLSRHMERLGVRNCPINIRAPNSKLGKLKEPDESFETVLRVLKFDDERVRDILVIAHGIEQILLIPSRTDAQHVLLDDRPPQNVNSCISFLEKRRGYGIRLVNRNGNISSSPIEPDSRQKPRMKSDEESQISFHKATLTQLQSEFRELELSKRNHQQAAQRCSQSFTQHKRQAAVLEKNWRNAGVKALAVEAELDKYEGADSRLQGLNEALRQSTEQQDHYGQQFGDLSVEKENQNKIVETLKTALRTAKEESGDFKHRIAKAEDKVKRYELIRHHALTEKNDAHDDLEVAKLAKEQAERSRDRQVETVEEYSRGASEVTPERTTIPEGETMQSIERKLQDIKDSLKRFREQHGADAQEINDRFSQAKIEYDTARRTRQNLTSLNRELKDALSSRLDKWRMFQRMISAQARTNFAYLLSERGFRGRLLLDHSAKKLDIRVEPDQTRKNVSGRNTKTLSGGEKSFSSICLLLAIWDAMGSPLRCLDEYDVFMDNVNRAISTNMLVQTARRSVGKQFILITPNAIEGRAKLDKDVTIIRLTDPRQRQITDY